MRDWKDFFRRRLALPEMEGHREERMLCELADHAEDLFLEARSRGAGEREAEVYVEERLGDAGLAAAELTRTEPAHFRAQAARWVAGREEELRSRGGPGRLLGDLIRDLRLAVRALARRPLFSAAVVLVLTLGIGSSTAIFTLLDAVILSPLPFHEADRLVALSHAAPEAGIADAGQCAAWHFTYEAENRVFEDLGLWADGQVAVIGDGTPEAVPALGVTSGVLRTLRVQPALGRSFTPEDEDLEAPDVLLLSHAYWQKRYAGDPGILGQKLQIDGVSSEIVGVLPPSLRSLWPDAALFVPLRFRQSSLFVGNTGLGGLARLQDGITLEEASADMARMLPLAFEKYPGGPADQAMRGANFAPNPRSLKEDRVGSVARLLWILMAGVGVLLLIACANVANLFLVRSEGKEEEMAVRSALGASPSLIGWEYLKESLVLGLVGGAGGLALAFAGLRFLSAMGSSRLPRLEEVGLDPTVLFFTVGISLGSGLFFGMIPASRYHRRGAAGSLKPGAGRAIGGKGRFRAQDALAVSQIALALLLLVAAALMVRSFLALGNVDPGFGHPEEVLTLNLDISPREIEDLAEVAQTQEVIARRLAEIPGVNSVGLATDLPMDGSWNWNTLYIEAGTEKPVSGRHKWIGEGYVETLRIPLLAGRTFTWSDIHNRIPAVLVSQRLAREYWGSEESALGKGVALQSSPARWHRVIGVVGNVRDDGLGQEGVAEVYWPQVTLGLWQDSAADAVFAWRSMDYVVRSPRVGSAGFLREIHEAVWSVKASLPLRDVGPLSELMARSVARTSFTLTLLAVAAIVALLLGSIGVYAVVSYVVSQRTRELALRMALGAQTGEVKGIVLRRALVLALTGTAAGLGLALSLTRLMAGLLFEVSPADPLTFLTVAAGLIGVTLLASYVPARRAAGVDPMSALRSE